MIYGSMPDSLSWKDDIWFLKKMFSITIHKSKTVYKQEKGAKPGRGTEHKYIITKQEEEMGENNLYPED